MARDFVLGSNQSDWAKRLTLVDLPDATFSTAQPASAGGSTA
jgi:hypothetical protein